MRIWTGPAGSGKTAAVLDAFRSALRAGRDNERLLVPTATLVEHIQHRFAREGFIFCRSLVQTLNGFVESRAPEVRQVSEAVLYLIVEEAAGRVNHPAFSRVVNLPGFCAALARTISEFSSAGCDSARLTSCLPASSLGEAFLAVYREVDRELVRRGLVLRARRLEIAAERIEREGLAGIAAIWLDGFHALPDPELRVLSALSLHADVTLTIAEADLDDRLRGMAGEIAHRPKSRSSPALSVVRAPGIERECDEIARRIVEQALAGRPFREIGVIVRSADTYAPILRSTFERFGIPARFYFDQELGRHPEVRHLTGVVDAMLDGWDHPAALAAIRLTRGFENSTTLDRFDFRVREQIPNRGLDALRELGPPEGALDRLATIEEWRNLVLTPREWAERVNRWARSRLIEEALEETAEALGERGAIGLAVYWRALKAVLRLKPLREPDLRRNAVNVISAHEARQWVLPVVYVCGMVEKQFPQFHRQDPFFPEPARRALNDAGVRVRTAGHFEREEQALFDSAITRATMSVTLTYPEFDSRGDRNLPSLYLESIAGPRDPSRPVRPAPRNELPPVRPVEICAPVLLQFIREGTARLAPSRLEHYLQCPYRYFGSGLLRLKSPPPRPEKRLDFMTQGSIVHLVLAAWWARQGDIADVFEEVFAREAAAKRIPVSYQTERARNAMLEDLRKFSTDQVWDRRKYESRTELEFDFPLDGLVTIHGKIDRLDQTRDGQAVVIDYKYSSAKAIKGRLENDNLLQAPLYLLAAERKFGLKPEAMYYLGIKGKVEYAQWQPGDNWVESAVAKTLRIVEEIRAGRIAVAPADRDNCRFCDSRDICRVETAGPAARGEGA
jgi:ATP-dependent helicase/DNAse subunit B